MNINTLFDYIPQRDAFFVIDIEDHNVVDVLPEFENNPEHCICIYNVSEGTVNSFLPDLSEKWEANIRKMYETISVGTMWEQTCKPIFLFENKEMAIVFMDYANTLDEEDFATFIDELQRDYNDPWRYVQLIRNEKVYDIIDHYERRFGDDSD